MDDPGYTVTATDRRPFNRGPRYRGYRGDDWERPYAKFFRAEPDPLPDVVRQAGRTGGGGFEVTDAAARMSKRGYGDLENGWTRTDRGTLVVACLTEMPGVTAPMWDWWFGWHSTDSARYKLWHPKAHLFSTVAEDRSANRTLSDRQRYQGNVSYVDEYIGQRLTRLAIRFIDPGRLGFEDRPGTTVICARVGPSDIPVAAGWLIHHVRPTEQGTEMRSRFFLGHPRALPLATRWPLPPQPLLSAGTRLATTDRFARNLLVHCGTEMHHLAGFLPELYEEFRGTA